MLGGDARPAQGAAERVPWVGLLLWMFACAALFVSLIMRDHDLEQDRRVAGRSVAEAQNAAIAYPAGTWTRPAGEFGAFTTGHPPSP